MQSDKNRVVAIALAFFLGGFGIHRFYIGDTKGGVLMFLFCWTFIPAIVALVDIIRFAMMTKEYEWNEFCQKYAR